ncbi:MAG: hypothetical protein WAL10_11045 [Acetobacteraceae bacterium]|jgi:hypothetical protein
MNDVFLELEERRVAQLERQIARQEKIIEEMVRDGQSKDRRNDPHASDDAPDQPATGAGARRALEGTATMTRTVEVLDPFVDGHACHICGRSGCVVVGDKGNFRLLCSNGE